MLWYSSRISLAYSKYGAQIDNLSRMPFHQRPKVPKTQASIVRAKCNVQDVSSFKDVIAKSGRLHTRNFLDEVLGCLGSGFMSDVMLDPPSLEVCHRGQLLRNAMMLYLLDEEIPPQDGLAVYPHSLKHAIQSVGKLPYSMRTDFFKKTIPRNAVCKS